MKSSFWRSFAILNLLLLIATNIYWLYLNVDHGTKDAASEQLLFERTEGLRDLLVLVNEPSNNLNESGSVRAISSRHKGTQPYEIDGYVWVGFVGLKTNEGKVVSVVPNPDLPKNSAIR